MDLTESYKAIVPGHILERFDWAETRNAAAILQATNGLLLGEVIAVLSDMRLLRGDLVDAGGQKSNMAARLDLAFRERGWREAKVDTEFRLQASLTPYRPAGEKKPSIATTETRSSGYKVDNLKGRVALDVEWNAKDGNLDRDLAAYRQLYANDVIDAAVLITRTFEDMRELARQLEPGTTKFNTSTTTHLGKLVPRLKRGDAGGCPVLAVAITARGYAPGV